MNGDRGRAETPDASDHGAWPPKDVRAVVDAARALRRARTGQASWWVVRDAEDDLDEAVHALVVAERAGTLPRLVPVEFRSELDPMPGVQLYRIEAP